MSHPVSVHTPVRNTPLSLFSSWLEALGRCSFLKTATGVSGRRTELGLGGLVLSDQVPNRQDSHGPARAQKTQRGQPRGPVHSQEGSGPPSQLPGRDIVAGRGCPAPAPIPWWNSSTEEDPHSTAVHWKQNASHAPEWNVQGKLPFVYFIQPSLAKILSFQHESDIKIINESFTSFHTKFSKSSVLCLHTPQFVCSTFIRNLICI